MNSVNRFFSITCTNRTLKNRICGESLGDIQLDVPNTSRRYCKNCKRLMEYVSDGDGRVTKEVLPQTLHVVYDDSIAVVEVPRGR